jgi:hypothetical protein
MTRWGKEKTGKGLSVASRAKAYLPGSGMSYGVPLCAPDEALIRAWSEWLTEAVKHIDELEAELDAKESGGMTLKKCTQNELAEYAEWYAENGIPGMPSYHDAIRGFASSVRDGAAERWLANGKGWPRPAPKEETAEERVRADIAATGDYCDTTITEKANLRAILAELDRVRAERDERTEGWRKAERKLAKLSKDMHEVSEMLFESKVEVEGLRSGMMPAAQRPVDVEAVLAPVRRLRSALSEAAVVPVLESHLEPGALAAVQGFAVTARSCLDEALAEAEKIGRGGT